jgi:hypothetical protein
MATLGREREVAQFIERDHGAQYAGGNFQHANDRESRINFTAESAASTMRHRHTCACRTDDMTADLAAHRR